MSAPTHGAAALERRLQRRRFATEFPGLLQNAEEAAGRTVIAVVRDGDGVLLVLSGGGLLPLREQPVDPDRLSNLLEQASAHLAGPGVEGAETLRRLRDEERAEMRLARMEKVVAAVEHNLPTIPELRPALLRLLTRTED